MKTLFVIGVILLSAPGCSVDVSVSFGGADAAATAVGLIEGDIADQSQMPLTDLVVDIVWL